MSKEIITKLIPVIEKYELNLVEDRKNKYTLTLGKHAYHIFNNWRDNRVNIMWDKYFIKPTFVIEDERDIADFERYIQNTEGN